MNTENELRAALIEVTARFGDVLDRFTALGFGKEDVPSWQAAMQAIESLDEEAETASISRMEMASEGFARGGMAGYNEATGRGVVEDGPPCRNHCPGCRYCEGD